MNLQRVPTVHRFSSALLTAGLIASVGWPAAAHAEPAGDNSVTAELTKLGQELCPQLVKPGASLATTVSELQGNSGLGPELTGMVTGLAIQLQCPAVMASLARGEVPEVLRKQAEKDSPALPALPFPLPGGGH